MTKYHDLARHLRSLTVRSWVAKFHEIEAILGFGLPRSAYSYPAWWSNQAGPGHTQSQSWQSAGWRTTNLDLAARRVTFARIAEKDDHTPISPARTVSEDMEKSKNPVALLTIAEARAGLAAYFGVPPENVEITIRG